MENLSILIADRVPLFSSGIQQMLLAGKGFKRVDVAESRKEVLQYLRAFPFDVLLMDTRLNDAESLDLLQQIHLQFPQQKVVFIGRMRDNLYLRNCIKCGLKGFILRNARLEEVINALNFVTNGGEYFSIEVAKVLYRLAADPILAEPGSQQLILSRELEVLRWIVQEKSNEEIADLMHISMSMVKKYRSNLLVKTDSKNTAGLVVFAIREGIVRL